MGVGHGPATKQGILCRSTRAQDVVVVGYKSVSQPVTRQHKVLKASHTMASIQFRHDGQAVVNCLLHMMDNAELETADGGTGVDWRCMRMLRPRGL